MTKRVGNHPPKPDCTFCNGTGQRYVKKHNRNYPCICLFVNHEHAEELGVLISKTAKKIREEEFGAPEEV